jgi:hypothetical protein
VHVGGDATSRDAVPPVDPGTDDGDFNDGDFNFGDVNNDGSVHVSGGGGPTVDVDNNGHVSVHGSGVPNVPDVNVGS